MRQRLERVADSKESSQLQQCVSLGSRSVHRKRGSPKLVKGRFARATLWKGKSSEAEKP